MDNVKLIIMDLDGTLLDNNKNVSPFNISVLDRCKRNGIKIAIATARSTKAAKRIIELIKPDFCILNDGALILNNKYDIIHGKFISKETVNALINECIFNKPDIEHITVETKNEFYRTYTDLYHEDWNYGLLYDFSNPLNKEAYKISIGTQIENMAIEIANKFNECKIIYNMGEPFYRFIHKGVGKMYAIEIISEKFNISISDIITFGDDYNDIEMVEKCGIGIAMENGLDLVKNVSKYVCKNNNEDGVGLWINANIL